MRTPAKAGGCDEQDSEKEADGGIFDESGDAMARSKMPYQKTGLLKMISRMWVRRHMEEFKEKLCIVMQAEKVNFISKVY